MRPNLPKTVIGSMERLALTYRYLYYVKAVSLISDLAYDQLEDRCLADPELPVDSPLREPGSDCTSSYSDDIKENARRLLKRATVEGRV